MNNNSKDVEIKIDNNITNTNKNDFSIDRFTQEDKNNKNIVENNNYIKKNILKCEKKKKKLFSINNLIIFGKMIKSILLNGCFRFYKGKPFFYKSFILLPCGHFFHSNCLENWIGVRKECPICRSPITQYI